jgi:hypothetical protein
LYYRWARRHYVFIFFLRSQASSIDQPNDRGVNAFFKALFDAAYARYKLKYPSIPFTRRSLNVVLQETNTAFLADPRLSDTIKKAWKVTGLSPFLMPEDV